MGMEYTFTMTIQDIKVNGKIINIKDLVNKLQVMVQYFKDSL